MATSEKIAATAAGALKSKTVALNTVAALLPVLDYALSQLPALEGFMPKEIYMYAFMGVIAANIVLRFYTNKALADKK